LVNDYEIIPGSVAGAEEIYPHNAIDYLKEKGLSVVALPASQMAKEIGDGRMANVVLLGAMSTLLPLPEPSWKNALKTRLPDRYLEGNLKAFTAGRGMMNGKEPN
jgi:indolepyruvate ferredoxin oxidoreductase beta subunit